MSVDEHLYSRRVVGWATSSNNDRFLALDCWDSENMAVCYGTAA